MKAIVAVDSKWGIGKNGDLLVHIPGDLKYFKKMTMGKILVVGRKTLESFPGGRPLPGRATVVLTENEHYTNEDCDVCKKTDDLIQVIKDSKEDLDMAEDVFVAGGGSIYRELLPCCDQLFITKIEGDFDADVYFPDIDENPDFEMVWESDFHEDNGVRYRFMRYERTK